MTPKRSRSVPYSGAQPDAASGATVAPDRGGIRSAADGRCRLTSGSWSWPALASLGRFDAEIAQVEPPELRAAFALQAARFSAAAATPG